MTKLLPVFVLIILAISIDGKRLHIGRTKAIAAKIATETRTAASAIKDMAVTSSRDKVELLVIANEFTHRIQQAIFVMNPAVPHIHKEQYKLYTKDLMISVEELLYDVQRTMWEDATKLQQKLVSSLEKYAVIIEKLIVAIVENHSDNESFLGDKIREASDIVIYGMYKIFSHASTATKSNKELEKETESGLAKFVSSFDRMKNNADETARDELTNLARFLTILGEEVILKLEYWINMNTKSTDGFKVVKETAQHLSEALDKMHRLVLSDKSTAPIFEEFKTTFLSTARQIKKLGDIQLRNVPGDQEYVRGVLVDKLALHASFAAEIDIYLATKQIP